MGWARSSTTSFGPNSSRRRSASAEDKPTGTGAPVIAGCATETSISRGDAEESFSPRQEKAKIARDATTKFGYSRGETEAARLQVALPAQLDLGGPNVDYVALGNGFGVPSVRAESGEDLIAQLERAVAEPGPHLIEVVVPSVLTPFQLKAMPHALRLLGHLPKPLALAVKRRLYP